MVFDQIVQVVKKIPNKVRLEIVDMAKSIQRKIRDYADAVSFKNDPAYLNIDRQHFRYLENLRHSQPEKYKQLVYFAQVYPTLDIDDQETAIVSFLANY